MTNIPIVDGDGHIMEEPNEIWTPERIDYDRWAEWVPHKEVIDEIYEVIHIGGGVRGGGRQLHDQMAAAVGMTPRAFYDLLEGLRRPGGHEPQARLDDMDVDGIDAVVLYPSLAMFFGPCDEIPALHDAAFVADCLRAYNDWLAEFCAYAPGRLFGVARRAAARRSRARAPKLNARSATGYGPCSCGRRHTSTSFRSTIVCTTISGRRARNWTCRSRSIPAYTSTRPEHAGSSGSSPSAKTRRSPTWRWTRSTAVLRSAKRSAIPST